MTGPLAHCGNDAGDLLVSVLVVALPPRDDRDDGERAHRAIPALGLERGDDVDAVEDDSQCPATNATAHDDRGDLPGR